MGLGSRENKLWNSEEEKYLSDNYSKSDVNQLSEYLNRAKSSVAGKIRRMGLSKRKKSIFKSSNKLKNK
ncbi:MAG: hypothetical protein M5T52_19225 [Ignavibacteriaceae bacterium]|nr:hypothetical protein [Ignavibacteriaceae bacterium]